MDECNFIYDTHSMKLLFPEKCPGYSRYSTDHALSACYFFESLHELLSFGSLPFHQARVDVWAERGCSYSFIWWRFTAKIVLQKFLKFLLQFKKGDNLE